METKANHIIIGAFVLVMIAALFAFVLWLARFETDGESSRYHIYFEGSVAGLSPAGLVRYRGIPVGRVVDIRIDPDNVERVRVTAEIDAATPIKADAFASLELQGITGIVFIEIKGGSQAAAALIAGPGQEYPVIASRPSNLASLFENLPRLVARLTALVEDADKLLNDENIRAVNETLTNIRDLTAMLSGRDDDLQRLFKDFGDMARAISATSADIGRLARRGDGMVDDVEATLATARGALTGIDGMAGDVQGAVADTRQTARTLTKVGEQLESLIAENRQSLRDFTGDGLYEFSRFLVEARVLVARLSRISAKLEEDAPRFLLGDRQGGVEAQ